jgi:tetratricopeptide (TPR) repeat protein
MYQRKIAQWGLDKKHKAPEMRAILRIARQRNAAGMQSIFRVRGRKIDIEEVYRYFKRKGEDPASIDVQDTGPTPSTVTVETPTRIETIDDDVSEVSFSFAPNQQAVPYPTPQTDYIATSNAGSISGSSTRSDSVVSTPLVFSDGTLNYQLIPNSPRMAMHITTPFEFHCSQILLHQTIVFFDSVVNPEFFSPERARGIYFKPWRRSLSSWSRATSEGHELMRRGQTDATFKLRSKALSSVKKHITNPSPIILFRYFEVIYALWTAGDEAFLYLTLKYVYDMALTVLGPGHPITMLTRMFLHPQAKSLIAPLAQQGIRKSLQIVFERCGPQHPRILYVLDSRAQTLLDEKQYDQAAKEAFHYLERAKSIRGDSSYEACQAYRMLGDAYVAQDQLEQAIEAYTKAYNLQQSLKSPQDQGVITVKAQRGLAGIARRQDRYPDAEKHLQVALQMAKITFGEEDVQVVLVQEDLDKVHEEIALVRGDLPYRPLDA